MREEKKYREKKIKKNRTLKPHQSFDYNMHHVLGKLSLRQIKPHKERLLYNLSRSMR
jgi:hypothetical protein